MRPRYAVRSLPLAAALLAAFSAPVHAQTAPGFPSPTARPATLGAASGGGSVYAYSREADTAPAFEADLKPFYHGVASGDPLPDGVLLWTRVTPDAEGSVAVLWKISTDAALANVVQSGAATAEAARDYTVKVDVRGLLPGTTYYYGFAAAGRNSLTGRTRTAPSAAIQASDRLRFAVVSCSNYPQGYFNAYARVAERADLDAVLHLGDYLYEYDGRVYGADRAVSPDREIVSLGDYRVRHSLYKLDPDLRRAHQQHPFITVWDDHESANDAYRDGAQNHQPDTEGAWADRKASAERAYFEWMPIREAPVERADGTRPIYRRLGYGGLADLVMIDTRLEGRQLQLAPKGGTGSSIDTLAWFAEDRTILGAEQYGWLTSGLKASPARWKIVGNQVMMMRFAPHPQLPPAQTFTNLDAWDGYPAERARLLTFLRDERVQNAVVLTGDIHSSWAADLPLNPFGGYNPATGAGSVAVEFTTTSVTSSTFAQGLAAAGIPEAFAISVFRQAYPQLKSFNLSQRGYFVLDLTPERAQADWFYVDIAARTAEQREGGHVFTAAGENRLQLASAAAPSKENAPALAPDDPPGATANEGENGAPEGLLFVGAYPNPASGPVSLHYAVSRAQPLRVELFDVTGRAVQTLFDGQQAPGVYRLTFATDALASGTYLCRFTSGARSASRTVVVAR